MANAASLVIQIKANTAQFDKAMKRARRRVNVFAEKSKRSIMGFSRSLKDNLAPAFRFVTKAISMTAKVLAALTVGLTTLVGIKLVSITQSFKELAQWSETLGTSVPELQKWASAAKTVGIEQEKLTDIFKDVNDKVGDFLMNNAGPMVEIFDRLGISIDQVRNKKPQEILELLSRKSAKLGKQQRVFIFEAIASDSAKLLPLLDKNSKALNTLFKEYEELGLVVTTTESEALKSFGSSLDFISNIFSSLANKVAASVAPAFAAFGESIKDSIKSYGGLGNVARSIGAFIVDSAATMLESFAELPIIIGGVANALSKLAAVGKSVFGFLVESSGRFGESIADVGIALAERRLEDAKSFGDTERIKEAEEALKVLKARKAVSQEQQQAGIDFGKDLATFETTVNESVIKRVSELKAAARAMREENTKLKETVAQPTTTQKPAFDSRFGGQSPTNPSLTYEPVFKTNVKDAISQYNSGSLSPAQQQPVKVENKVIIEGDLRGIINAVFQSEDFQSFKDSITEFGVEDAARSVTQ